MDERTSARAVPAAAAWLGGSGLLPFAALAFAAHGAGGEVSAVAGTLLAGYGGAILSFMGGCRWGFAAAGFGRGPHPVDLAVSVSPALYAWAVVGLLDWNAACLALAPGFVALLAADIALTRRGGAPLWWPRLRWPLTIGAAGALAIGGLA